MSPFAVSRFDECGLHVEKGDVIYITESPDGYRITPHSEDFEAQMKAARAIMKKRRAVLRELAK